MFSDLVCGPDYLPSVQFEQFGAGTPILDRVVDFESFKAEEAYRPSNRLKDACPI
jgi:hypothetical protein